MTREPDIHDYTAIGRLLGISADQARTMVERYQETDGYQPEFCLRYDEVAAATGVPVSTLRSRVASGYYAEGVDYLREGPRTVWFSRRVLRRDP